MSDRVTSSRDLVAWIESWRRRLAEIDDELTAAFSGDMTGRYEFALITAAGVEPLRAEEYAQTLHSHRQHLAEGLADAVKILGSCEHIILASESKANGRINFLP